jgi:hypothetical protein
MNYISQTIVFALALMGTLFKSTKTDAGGKTIYGASGLPVLTTTGRVVVTLLSIFFCISLITIWQKNKSEEAASRAQEELKAYNKGIDDTLARVFAKTSELSDEQNKKFQAVLSQQKDTGDKIATGIQSSSELLRNRVESSSTLLSGKIGDSIGLLNHSANSIASLLDPITTVQVELLVLEIPLDDPALTSYRNRIEPSIRQFQATGAMETDHLGCSLAGPGGISIASNSKLLPDRVSERVAYNLLSLASVDIFLFKNSLADSRIQTSSAGEYDVHIPVQRKMNYVKGENDQCTSDEHFELFYDLDAHRAFVRVRQLNFNPRSNADEELRQRNPLQGYYTTWQKSAGGNISGVPVVH